MKTAEQCSVEPASRPGPWTAALLIMSAMCMISTGMTEELGYQKAIDAVIAYVAIRVAIAIINRGSTPPMARKDR